MIYRCAYLIPAELAKGFGFLHGKPGPAFSPVAVTPDELGEAWDGAKVHLPLQTLWNGGRSADRMRAPACNSISPRSSVTPPRRAAACRHGSRFGDREQCRSGDGILRASSSSGRWRRSDARTHRDTLHAATANRLRIEMLDRDGRSIFGAIAQEVRVCDAEVFYTYFRSSAAYRVRIALAPKAARLRAAVRRICSRRAGVRRVIREINPQGFVPVLVADGVVLTQSLAIIEYLDEVYPEPPLLPAGAQDRAYVRGLAQLIACDVHPLNNLRVLNYLKTFLGQGEEACRGWYRHWIAEGFAAFERQLECRSSAGRFCFGDTATLADLCLVPQMYNARRFECDLSAYPRLQAIDGHCSRLPEFCQAAPEAQPDAAA